MAIKYLNGRYEVKNPEKYAGDPTRVFFRSSLELRFMIFLDSHDSILSWSSEEIIIPYYWEEDKKVHRYFPDFYVKMRNKNDEISESLIEIKPSKQLKPPPKKTKINKVYLSEVLNYSKNQAKWSAAEEYCKKRGWDFKIITEKDLFLGKK